MAHDSFPVTGQTTPTREKERVSYERTAANEVLDEAVMCHVGFVVDGRPVVLPHVHARVGDQLYLHGSSGARALRMASAEGLDVCVTVTMADGIILTRSAFNHSMNYRSVVIHGRAEIIVDDDGKQAALLALVDALVPGRSDDVRGPTRKELAKTTVLRLPLETASLKARTGPAIDDDDDLPLPYWAGVIPLHTVASPPEPALDLTDGVTTPDNVTRWAPTSQRR